MITRTAGLRGAVLSAAFIAAAMPTARAACYDILGCSNRDRFSAHAEYLDSRASGPTCAFLFTMRNSIFQEHGYCFHTARARQEFGNQGCSVDDVRALALDAIERANVAAIARAESLKGCPRS